MHWISTEDAIVGRDKRLLGWLPPRDVPTLWENGKVNIMSTIDTKAFGCEREQ
jgi:hypothetical protein